MEKKSHKCKYCNKEIEKVSGFSLANHIRWCKLNPNRKLKKLKSCIICGIEHRKRSKTCGDINCIKKSHIFTDEVIKVISNKRKKYLSENKNKHNWSIYRKKETEPERRFRKILKELKIKAKQYYIPIESDKNYEIDFAIIDSKIGFEINGNQHYNKEKNLLDYYIKRNAYLNSLGWKIVNIHYLNCFNDLKIKEIIKLSL